MKLLNLLIILMLTISGFSVVNADVYTWVDENGVRNYSDSPPDDVEDPEVVFPEYQYDESADKNRIQQDDKTLELLIKEIEEDNAREQEEARKRIQEAQQNREPTREERIAAEKERLEKKIAFLEEQPLEYFGSQRNKILRLGYYHYQIEDLMQDPDKYFDQPVLFEGNVKYPPGTEPEYMSGAAGY